MKHKHTVPRTAEQKARAERRAHIGQAAQYLRELRAPARATRRTNAPANRRSS